MPKKMIALLVSVILLIVILFGLYYITRPPEIANNPLKSVPVDASLVIKINDFEAFKNKIKNENIYWNELHETPLFKNWDKKISMLDSVAWLDEDKNTLPLENSLFISVHDLGKRKLESIYYLPLEKKINSKTVLDYLHEVINNPSVSQRKYDGTTIVEVKNGQSGFFYYLKDGLLVISKSSILIESSIRQSKLSISLENNQSFQEIINTAGNYADANVFVHHEHFLTFLQIIGHDQYSSKIENLRPIANWTALDLLIKDNYIIFNGFSNAFESESSLVDAFRNQAPVNIEIDKVIPAYISGFMSFGIDDFNEYFKEIHRSNNSLTTDPWRNEEIIQLKSSHKIDLESFMNTNFNNEAGLVFPDASYRSTKPYFLIELKSQSIAADQLTGFLEEYALSNGQDLNNYIHYSDVDREKKYQILQLPVQNIPSMLFGSIFSKANHPYVVFIENYMVFGSSVSSLSEFLHYNMLNKTIYHDARYEQFKEYMAEQSNFLFFLNTPLAKPLFKMYFNDRIHKQIDQHFSDYKKIESVALQFSKESDMYYNNLVFSYSTAVKEKPKTTWESMLDTSMDFKPVFFTNHYTNEKEIFVQDENNNIYLMNGAGKVLWKINLNEQINSEVFVVDYYDNGKLQLLFSTKNYLHLFDRNGNYVENYPVKLRSPASAGMNLVQYLDNKQRILIPAENKKIYNYDLEGKLIKGWQFGTTEHPVKNKIQHFIIGTRDYIICSDKYRVYILNRRGLERIKPEKQFPGSVNNIFYLEDNHPGIDPRFVTTDTSGTIHYIYENGQTDQKKIRALSPDHYFLFEDINGDRVKDYVFLDHKVLSVYNHQYKPIFNHQFKTPINQEPIYFEFSGTDKKIGITSNHENQIYLLNNNGTIYQGFPLTGSSLFSIGLLNSAVNGNYNLIVGGENNFLYNYQIK